MITAFIVHRRPSFVHLRNLMWICLCTVLASWLILPADDGFAQSLSGEASGPAPVALAAAVSQAPPASGNTIFIDKKIPTAARAAATSALVAKASARGLVRVIIGLNVGLQAPHELSESTASRQQAILRAAQTSVVSRILGSAAGTASVTQFDYIPFVAMTVTPEHLDRLIADPDVVNIQEDVPLFSALTQSVPFINADDVWTAGFPGTGFAVAIIDSGVDKTHNMFPSGKIVSEACYSTTIPEHSASLCPGGVHSSIAPGSGVNCPYPAISGCEHGTLIAGIAAGNMVSPLLRGVAKSARIIAIKIASRYDSEADCAALASSPAPCLASYTSDMIRGLQRVYALSNTIAIAAVNLSQGGPGSQTPCDATSPATKAAIDLLRAVRIATVVSSGNGGVNGGLLSPSCISSAIAVGSTLDTANILSDFSNHAANVRLLAPGENIQTSVPPGPATTLIPKGGTSFSTPHVAGAFALLRDVNGGATVDDIAAALECTGVPITRAGITRPRIDVDAARKYLLNPPNISSIFNFSAAAQATQWSPFVGSWSVNAAAPGTYRVTSVTSGWNLSTIPNCNEDVTITSRLRRIWPAGQTSNTGIAFKAQVSTTNKTLHGYVAAIARDLPDKDVFNVVLYRFDGVNLQTGEGPATLLCGNNSNIPPITSGEFHTLQVVSQGGFHEVILDDVTNCQVTDHSYGTGRTGLITFFDSPPAGNAFEIDRFVVVPNETVPPSIIPSAEEVATGR